MGTWRIQKRYGRGVARVVLSASPYRSDLASLSLIEGMRLAGPEMFRAARAALVVVSVLTLALILTLGRDRQDVSTTQIIVFRDAETIPQPESKPLPLPAEALPKPEPPAPPAPRIAEAKPPPPPPPPTPIEVAPKPPPIVIAKTPPPPPPVREIVRPKPPPPAPEPMRPRIEVAALAPAPAPARLDSAPRRQPTRQHRQAPQSKPALRAPALTRPSVAPEPPLARPTRTSPAIAAVRTPRIPRPDLRPATPLPKAPPERLAAATRSERPQFAAARTKTRASPQLQLASVPSSPALSPVEALAPRRATRSAPAPSAANPANPANRRPQPRLEPTAGLSGVPRLAESNEPRSLRSQRTARAPLPILRDTRSGARVSLAPAALARGTIEEPRPSPVTRRAEFPSERPQPTAARNQAGELRGVPLGDLASCLTDREEALLKQRVLAAVTNRMKCVSLTGTYRFVETKNLNSFLMWIERAPGRAASDRCVELNNALACLEPNS